MRRRTAALVALLGCDASSRVSVLASDLPEEVDRAALVVEGDGRQILEMTPIFPRSGTKFEIRAEVDDAQKLWVLGYQASLLDAEFGAVDTRVDALRIAKRREMTLPQPSYAGSVSADGGELQADAWHLDLTAAWAGGCVDDPCELIPLGDVSAIPLDPEPEAILTAAAFDETTAIACGRGAGFFRLSQDHAEPWTTGIPDSPALASWSDPNGRVWIYTESSDLWSGTIAGFEKVTSVTAESRGVGALTGGIGPSGVEVYVATDRGELFLFLEGSLRKIHQLEVQPSGSPQVVWLGAGHVVAAYDASRAIVFVDATGASEETFAREISNLAIVPGAGLVLTTGRELGQELELYAHNGTTWERITSGPSLPASVEVVAPFGLGAFVGGVRGTFSYWVPGLGSCDGQVYSSENIRTVVALRDRFFMAGGGVQRAELLSFEVRAGHPRACRHP